MMDAPIDTLVHSRVCLDELQGKWVASGGTVIEVLGSSLSMNGFSMPLKLEEDGIHVVGYGVYKAVCADASSGSATWLAPGPMQVEWQRIGDDEIRERTEKMNARMHERAAICGGQSFGVNSEKEIVDRLNTLIEKWREGPIVKVKSCDICPDWTNRAQTGLSVDHVHYIATKISSEGFKSRHRGDRDAHDVPVLIRESIASELGKAAMDKWHEVASSTRGFPPFLLEGKDIFYCSLGNGHFSQALNLFRVGARSLWSENYYVAGSDAALCAALDDGIDSVVLSSTMPTDDRRFVSEMLNRSHGRQWRIGNDCRVEIDSGEMTVTTSEQFVALSKVLDAEELSCLVRRKMNQEVKGEAQVFLADTFHVSA